MNSQNDTVTVSVIIVTYNPREDLLNWALDSLEKQTLAKSFFEVIVVDNNSAPPLDPAKLSGGRALNLRLVREPRQGIMFARCAGIAAARADLMVFVDDDNHLDPDYLEQSLHIAHENPGIGAFGGISRGVFEGPVSSWQERILPHLGVRDYGPEPITSHEPSWGKWEPIGAGMVVRRDAALNFVEFLKNSPLAQGLGRQGQLLLSGDDTLMARAANRLGYACSYQPVLKLSHHMKQGRLTFKNLSRTVEGHGRSYVLLRQIQGQPEGKPGLFKCCITLLARWLYRVKTDGVMVGTVEWHWDLGYFRQARM
jgi:glycosyltransferase involved in cell wall biosynthesis